MGPMTLNSCVLILFFQAVQPLFYANFEFDQEVSFGRRAEKYITAGI
jgi:hypothetical protein